MVCFWAHVNNTEPCKCRQLPCPIPDKCNARSVIYKAEVAGISYIGLTANAIKQRICGHRQSFREEAKKNASTLATFVWDNNLNKDDNGNAAEPKITWSILKNCHVYTAGQKVCDLCLSEKLFLIKAAGDPKNINKRNDIANRCVHKQKQYYSTVTWATQGVGCVTAGTPPPLASKVTGWPARALHFAAVRWESETSVSQKRSSGQGINKNTNTFYRFSWNT